MEHGTSTRLPYSPSAQPEYSRLLLHQRDVEASGVPRGIFREVTWEQSSWPTTMSPNHVVHRDRQAREDE